MNEVLRLLANDDEAEVHISANRRYIVFNTAGYTIMSRLIEGEFLNYKNVIPDGYRTQAVLDTKGFVETIERASLIITERLKNPLRITFTDGKVIVRCQTSLGRVMDEFAAACEGDEVEIGFNNRYLLDALRNARTEQVRVQLSGPLSPVKILPAEGDDFLYLVLPGAVPQRLKEVPGWNGWSFIPILSSWTPCSSSRACARPAARPRSGSRPARSG